jgi:hypothetical protein
MFEAEDEAAATKMAVDKHSEGKKNFNVVIVQEATPEEVSSTSDIRHADGVHDTTGGDQPQTSEADSNPDTKPTT